MIYQIRWAMDPGLRGISCCDFARIAISGRAKPDNEGGVAVDFASDAERDAFLRQLEETFRRAAIYECCGCVRFGEGVTRGN